MLLLYDNLTNYQVMKKKYLFSICFFCISIQFYSQSNNELIERYKQACRENARNTDSLFFYSKLLLKINDPSAQYEGFFAKAYAHRSNMQIDSATVSFQRTLEFATDKTSRSRAIRMSLITAANAGDNERALTFYRSDVRSGRCI